MSDSINVTADLASLIMSEGASVVEGCQHGKSVAGSILAVKYDCPRWAAEAAVLESFHVIVRQFKLEIV